MIRTKAAAAFAVRVSFFAFIFLFGHIRLSAQSNDDAADRLFDRAGQAQNNGDFEFAAELWDKFLKEHADNAQVLKARHYAGVCRMTLKEFDQAIQAFSKVVEDKKADSLSQLEESYYYLGWCQYSKGQQGKNSSLKKAIQTFDRHIKKFDKGKFLDQIHFLKGESLYFLGRKKESIASYAKVVSDFEKSTSRPNAMYAMGVSQFEIKNYVDAESTFDLFLSEFGDQPLADEIRLFRAESMLQRGLAADANSADRKRLVNQAKQSLAELASNQQFVKRDEAIFNQALCESQLANYTKAASLYATVAESFTQSPFANAARLSAGKLYLRQKDYAKAEKWLKSAADADQKVTDEAMHWYCQSLLRQNKFEPARKAAAKALSSATNSDFLVRLKMDLADAQYAIAAEKDKSIQTYLDIAENHSEHSMAPQALYNAAFASLELKKFAQGLDLTEKFLDQFADDSFVPDVKYVRGECLLLDKKFGEAESIYLELIDKYSDKENSEDAAAWKVRYALCLYLQDKYNETIEFLSDEKANLKPGSQTAEANFLIGASYFYQDQFTDSIDYLTKATAVGDQLKQIDEGLVLLAQALANGKQFKKAVGFLEQLTADYPKSRYIPQGNYLAGQYHSNEKAYAKAIEKYDKVLAADRTKYTAFASYGKGWALLNTQKNMPAKEAFSFIIESFDGHDLLADAYYSRAVANRRINEFKAAVSDIEKCLTKDPKFKNLVSALYEKGMAQSADRQYKKAVATFQRLVSEFGENKDADEFHYQLAWAYKSNKENDKAVSVFQKLCKTYPDSVAAAESHYHVAEDFYQKKQYSDAIGHYEKAAKQAKAAEIGEKSRYKLAWSHYQAKDFVKARDAFETQVTTYDQGDLADSGRFMVAECFYQQDKFAEAFTSFEQVVPVVLKSKNTNDTEKALACLHAAETANKVRKYSRAVEFVRMLQEDLKDQDYVAETWLELGNAKRGLKEFSPAINAFSQAFDLANNETGARAGFLVGEVLFQQKKYADAIRQYKLVIYGYGGNRAPDSIKKWQCSSGYETARCYHVQIKNQNSNAEKKKMIDEARKFYGYVVQNHAQDRLAAESKKQLAVLDKLK